MLDGNCKNAGYPIDQYSEQSGAGYAKSLWGKT